MADSTARRTAYLTAGAVDSLSRFQRAQHAAAHVAHWAQHADRDEHNQAAVEHYASALSHITDARTDDERAERATMHHGRFLEWHELVAAVDLIAYELIQWIELLDLTRAPNLPATIRTQLSGLVARSAELDQHSLGGLLAELVSVGCARNIRAC